MLVVLEQTMKTCTRCGTEKPVDEFGINRTTGDGLNRQCRGCVQGCQQMRQIKAAERHQQFCEMHKTEIEERKRKHDRANTVKAIAAREYRHTFEGCLRSRFAAMRNRCDNPGDKDYVYYGARDIQCNFTFDGFLDHVIHDLELFVYEDLTDKQIHRIDPDGHYEPSNIEFLIPAEHAAKHREMRRK